MTKQVKSSLEHLEEIFENIFTAKKSMQEYADEVQKTFDAYYMLEIWLQEATISEVFEKSKTFDINLVFNHFGSRSRDVIQINILKDDIKKENFLVTVALPKKTLSKRFKIKQITNLFNMFLREKEIHLLRKGYIKENAYLRIDF